MGNKKEKNLDFTKSTFEENLNELEKIVSTLESENTSLEESLKLYQKGINISIYLNKILDNIQGKIEVFKEKTQNGEIITDPFYFDFSKMNTSFEKPVQKNKSRTKKNTKKEETENISNTDVQNDVQNNEISFSEDDSLF